MKPITTRPNAKSASGLVRRCLALMALGCVGSVAPVTGQSTLYTFYDDSAGDEFATDVRGAGDVNADGFADVIVGAWFDDNNGIDSGSARVFYGFDG